MKKTIIIALVVIVILAILWYVFKPSAEGETSTFAGIAGITKPAFKPSAEALNVRSWGVYEGINPVGFSEVTNWGGFAWNVRDILTEASTREGRQQNQKFFDDNAGKILGFFKGMDLNQNIWWGGFNALAPDIKRYLASSSAKDVNLITKGQFLTNA